MATEIARWIASHREERKQNQTEFARSVGVSLRSVQNWEAGATVPAGRQRRLLVSYIGEDLPGTPLSTAAELAALREDVTRLSSEFRELAERREARYDELVASQRELALNVKLALEALRRSAEASGQSQPKPRQRRRAG